MKVDLDTGMIAVVPAWKLSELLSSSEVVDDRTRFQHQLDEMKSRHSK